MEEKKYAYQLDSYGVYVGLVERQKSPLEEGVWLVPGGAVIEPELPSIPEGQFARLVNGEWQFIDAATNHFVHYAYMVDQLGFFNQAVLRSNYEGAEIPPTVVWDVQMPPVPEGKTPRFVEGEWVFLTPEEVTAVYTASQEE